MAKPMKTLELHYPMIQFLIIPNIKYNSHQHKLRLKIYKQKIYKHLINRA